MREWSLPGSAADIKNDFHDETAMQYFCSVVKLNENLDCPMRCYRSRSGFSPNFGLKPDLRFNGLFGLKIIKAIFEFI